MKVLLTGTSLLPVYGGPAFSVSRLATALAQAGIDVGLWAADQSAEITPLLNGLSVRCLIGTEREAFEKFGKVDVIHDNGIWLPHNHRLARLADARGVVRIVSPRGMLEPWAIEHRKWKKRIAWQLYQARDLKRADCHHATAESEARSVRCLELGVPVCVIPNGIDVPERDPHERGVKSNRRERVALFLGRVHPKKGLTMLVEAWARVRPRDWLLQIVGPDEEGHRSQLEKLVSHSGLRDVVSFSDAADANQRSNLFHDAELVVLPTHSENFGMVVAEALAHGVPVLTTRGAPWSMLLDYECGWWVEPTIGGVAHGLRQATLCHTEMLRAMGRNGRALVTKEFCWDQVATRFITTYEEILSFSRTQRQLAEPQ
jgi:glycosyltransferase involved in cell wall biosynthesis